MGNIISTKKNNFLKLRLFIRKHKIEIRDILWFSSIFMLSQTYPMYIFFADNLVVLNIGFIAIPIALGGFFVLFATLFNIKGWGRNFMFVALSILFLSICLFGFCINRIRP